MNVLLVAYGTLKAALKDYLVGDVELIGDLYDLGPFPAVVNLNSSEHTFLAQIFEIPEAFLKDLDLFEGVDWLYRRDTVSTEFGDAFIYVMNRSVNPGATRIKQWRNQ